MAYNEGGGFGRNRGFRGRGGGGFRRFPREMTKIKCSECGKEAEVPFKPREGTPVYCRDCYFKKKGITPRQPAEEQSGVESEAKAETESKEETEEKF
ncbi:hypothetical protein COS75_03220 [Candidatus Pacearchaeota archaeon CG06_land_8_20_14_3_00_35_12]|nr:MAG: hypothetical protein COS75_03220 [Candidatus Pacearchaeota archaeon CG06_land_8_20_14_3_00_35_12]